MKSSVGSTGLGFRRFRLVSATLPMLIRESAAVDCKDVTGHPGCFVRQKEDGPTWSPGFPCASGPSSDEHVVELCGNLLLHGGRVGRPGAIALTRMCWLPSSWAMHTVTEFSAALATP